MRTLFTAVLLISLRLFSHYASAQTGLLCSDESGRQTGLNYSPAYQTPVYQGYSGPLLEMCLAADYGEPCAPNDYRWDGDPLGWLRVRSYSAEEVRVWPDHGDHTLLPPSTTVWIELTEPRSVERSVFNICPEG